MRRSLEVRSIVRRQHHGAHDERGAAMVEYALLLAGIAIVVGAAVILFGDRLVATYNTF